MARWQQLRSGKLPKQKALRHAAGDLLCGDVGVGGKWLVAQFGASGLAVSKWGGGVPVPLPMDSGWHRVKYQR